MDNYDIAAKLSDYAQLLELYDSNTFKIRSYSTAAYNISKKIREPLGELSEEALLEIPSLGKGLAAKVYEIAQTGSFEELNDLLISTPTGVQEMLHIKGIGPKKVSVIWKELGIDTVGDLLYACQENRLVAAKGFGLKTQAQIIKDIEYKASNSGLFHWAKVEPFVVALLELIRSCDEVEEAEAAGDFRRLNESIDNVEIVAACNNSSALSEYLKQSVITIETVDKDFIKIIYAEILPVTIYTVPRPQYAYELLKHTATEEHLTKTGFTNLTETAFNNEEAIYTTLGLPYILPELRE
ncbi:MAG: hypothetical protein H7321_07455, partial [Bacteroidia bacterium]|nr:hypothetical protein [Bacteroidia bacterium]